MMRCIVVFLFVLIGCHAADQSKLCLLSFPELRRHYDLLYGMSYRDAHAIVRGEYKKTQLSDLGKNNVEAYMRKKLRSWTTWNDKTIEKMDTQTKLMMVWAIMDAEIYIVNTLMERFARSQIGENWKNILQMESGYATHKKATTALYALMGIRDSFVCEVFYSERDLSLWDTVGIASKYYDLDAIKREVQRSHDTHKQLSQLWGEGMAISYIRMDYIHKHILGGYDRRKQRPSKVLDRLFLTDALEKRLVEWCVDNGLEPEMVLYDAIIFDSPVGIDEQLVKSYMKKVVVLGKNGKYFTRGIEYMNRLSKELNSEIYVEDSRKTTMNRIYQDYGIEKDNKSEKLAVGVLLDHQYYDDRNEKDRILYVYPYLKRKYTLDDLGEISGYKAYRIRKANMYRSFLVEEIETDDKDPIVNGFQSEKILMELSAYPIPMASYTEEKERTLIGIYTEICGRKQ